MLWLQTTGLADSVWSVLHHTLASYAAAAASKHLWWLMPPAAWGCSSDVDSVFHKGLFFISDCSIGMMLNYLEWSFLWHTEFSRDARALSCDPVPFFHV